MSISILLLVLVILFFNFHYWVTDDNIGNLEVNISDSSITNENPSCKVIFDDSIVYKINRISDFKTKRFKLKNGKHKVEVSDLNDNFYSVDTITIKNYPEQNELYISFKYHPNYKEYLPIYKKIYYNRYIKKHKKKSEEVKNDVLHQINQKIDTNYLIDKDIYKPIDRSFEINFYDERIIIM